jgi:nucleoside-diphosphate-sugar epimerase
MEQDSRLKVLVTGGCGKIGSYFARKMQERYAIRVIDKDPWDAERLGAFNGETLTGDIRDAETCRRACAGMHAVIHLAADPDPGADFMESLLENNIVATYNMLRAAKQAGCRRFIFASSLHVMSAYPPGVQVRAEMPVHPGNLYGASKAAGEALAAHFAYNEGLPCIAIRIGAYRLPGEAKKPSYNEMDAYLNGDDFNHLLAQGLETPGVTFLIAHGISDNRFKRADLTETKEALGYQPQADVFDLYG